MSRVKRLWSAIKPTDGPGHTDHPRVDIKAHRSNAKMIRWLGYLLGAVFLFGAAGDIQYAFAALGVVVLTQFASMGLRLQAVEWEVQLDDDA